MVLAATALTWVILSRPTAPRESLSASYSRTSGNPLRPAPAIQHQFFETAAGNASSRLESDTESAPTAEAKQTILDTMYEASITYDAAQLPVIRPYLIHSDPEIREAAVNAMVVLGISSAGPLLREAAKLAPTAKEAAAMEEAADYVELPPANLGELLKGKQRQKLY
jgi:hypothetical protein